MSSGASAAEPLSGIAAIADNYDAFILDQYGVVRGRPVEANTWRGVCSE